MSNGPVLAARRGELGLTIRQAASATRIGAGHLEALEADDLSHFAAPVYAAGHLKAYARFLGLEPGSIQVPAAGRPARANLALDLENRHRRPRAVVTGPALLAALAVLLTGGVAGYMWRQIVADPHPSAATRPAPSPLSSHLAVTPPAVQARPIVVGVRVTDAVWINATVDGQPRYGDSGTTLAAGSVVYFTGVDVKITSGKASATYISIDGKDLGPLGIGVATWDFSSQTSSRPT